MKGINYGKIGFNEPPVTSPNQLNPSTMNENKLNIKITSKQSKLLAEHQNDEKKLIQKERRIRCQIGHLIY